MPVGVLAADGVGVDAGAFFAGLIELEALSDAAQVRVWRVCRSNGRCREGDASFGERVFIGGAERVERLIEAVVVYVAVGGVASGVADVGVGVQGEVGAEGLDCVDREEGLVLIGRIGDGVDGLVAMIETDGAVDGAEILCAVADEIVDGISAGERERGVVVDVAKSGEARRRAGG